MWIEKHGPTFRIRDERGGRKVTVSSGYPTKTAAKTAMKVLEGEQVAGDLILPSAGTILVRDWIATWWEARKAGLKPNTVASEWSRIRANILPDLGDLKLREVTPLVVQNWASDLGKAKAAKTVANAHGVLHTIMRDAAREKLVRGSNPCEHTKLPIASDVQEMRFLTQPEADRLVKATPEHYQPLIVMALMTGMRWGELVGLKAKYVDILAGTVQVAETLSELSSTGALVWGTPKSRRSRRTIGLPKTAIDALVPLVTMKERDAPVFVTTTGLLIRTRNFRRVWLQSLRGAGLEPERPDGLRRENAVRFHDLRHTHAAWLLSANRPPLAVSRRLGHSSITITMDRYGHLLPEVDEGIIEVLDRSLSWGEIGGNEPRPALSNPVQPSQTKRSTTVAGR